MKILLHFEGITEEERVNADKTVEELKNAGFMFLVSQQVWVPMQYWFKDGKYVMLYD